LKYLDLDLKVANRDLKCKRVIGVGLNSHCSDINPKFSTACDSPVYASPE
jgi:hypothetical protein